MHDSVFGPILAALLGEYHKLHCCNCQGFPAEPNYSPAPIHPLHEAGKAEVQK